jgi:hypothetical protein
MTSHMKTSIFILMKKVNNKIVIDLQREISTCGEERF